MFHPWAPGSPALRQSEISMSDASKPQSAAERAPRITELSVSGHLMTLETGVFCIVQMPSKGADPATGFPGVRISVPPGPVSRPEMVEISSFSPNGWLSGFGDAALVRVSQGPAQVLVTIYKGMDAADQAPSLQVLRLLDRAPPGAAPARIEVPPPPAPVPAPPPAVMDMVAHIQGRGDVGAMLGDWMGEPGSKRWIEGFAIAPSSGLGLQDIEYQAVLGRGWLSPWAEGGQFCGSRGMALPVLGLRLRLRGAAAELFDCTYTASFVDGTEIGPVNAGETCEAESLAPLEAFRVQIRPRDAASAPRAAPGEVEAETSAPKAAPKEKKPKKAPAAPEPAKSAGPAATQTKPVTKRGK